MTPPVATIRPVEDDDLPILYEHQADPIANAMAVVPAKDRPAFDAHWVKIRRAWRGPSSPTGLSSG